MFETHRHQYLSAMGLDSYMPRLILPAAPLSQECEWPTVPVSEQAAEPVTESPLSVVEAAYAGPQVTLQTSPQLSNAVNGQQSISAKVDKAANELLQGLGSEGAVSARVEVLNKAEQELPANVEAVKFTLSIWRLDDYLIVDQRDSSKALPTEKLLLNMLKAIKLPLANLPKVQVLRWPMLEGGIADESAEAARDMLSAFFDTGTTEHKVWLLMGQAAQIALTESDSPVAAGSVLGLDDLDTRFRGSVPINVAILPSLVDMLTEPALKASAWQALKQL